MKKYLYIVNPTSGKGRGRKAIPVIEDYCKKNDVNYSILETKYPLHAKEITEKNNNNSYDMIVSVGGDGTLNEIVNGFTLGARMSLGVLPVGSGNDFAKNLGFNNNIKDNLSLIHKSENHEFIDVDMGVIDYLADGSDNVRKHRFINNLGIGFDAYVGYINQTNKIFKGIISYIYAVFKALLNYKMIETELSMEHDEITGERLMVSIGNGICSGGGFYLNPKAEIDDGHLDISIFDKITRRRLLTALPMALMNKIEKVPEAKLYRTNKSIDIKLNNPYYVHCDGEIITEKLVSAKISIESKAIKVLKKAGG